MKTVYGIAPTGVGTTGLVDSRLDVWTLPNLVTMKNVSFVTLRGMTLEACRGTAISIAGGARNRVVGCVIRNTGAWAVGLGGKESGVIGCDLYNLADGGVSMAGGNRKTLTPAGLYVDNCHLFKFGRWNPICKPGVQVDGVGNRVTHSLFHDAPHMAVMWGGNDHLFEFNEFHSVVYGANDAGIMYAGYNPAMRGHLIRFNYAEPRGNLVARNICWGGKWDEVEAKARPGVTFTDNLTGQDPHFVDAATQNFQLREDSPAWKLGFRRIPLEKIGLYASDDRASWPVRHEIRRGLPNLSRPGENRTGRSQ